MTQPRTLIFSGMIAADPHQGGATWAVLQYLLGFKKLGWNVCFIEPVSQSKLKPAGVSLAESENARYFESVVNSFGSAGCSTLLLEDTQQTVGIDYQQLCSIVSRADLLINISGMLTDPNLFNGASIRVYLDLDPGFVQIWHAQGIDMRFEGHTHFVTVGQLIGSPNCFVPSGGKDWLHTLPPVVMNDWPVVETPPSLGLTTIGNWRAYGSVGYHGYSLGQKVHSIRQLMNLPVTLGEPITLAMQIDTSENKDLLELAANQWKLIDPLTTAGTPAQYKEFIANSKVEIGITKQGYVVSRCGWFSDRSTCYLASGRPVIAQETGWSSVLPADEGLFAFESLEQAGTAMQMINSDYALHCRAARNIAQEYFESDKVLARLLSIVGVTP